MSLPRADLFPDLIVLTSPHERSAYPIPSIFGDTLQATKPITFVDVKDYFWCHRWLLPSLISLLFHINSLLSKGSLLWLKFLYSIQCLDIGSMHLVKRYRGVSGERPSHNDEPLCVCSVDISIGGYPYVSELVRELYYCNPRRGTCMDLQPLRLFFLVTENYNILAHC